MYILFEGIDGVGKSTQIELLEKKLPNSIVTKEPGGTEFGMMARHILLHSDIKSKKAELLLFLADRAEHFSEVIEPNLEKIIISDRGLISGIAYALEAGFEMDFLIELNRFVLNDYLPQKVVILKITKDELIKRIADRGEMDKIEQRGFDYLMRIQDNIIRIAKTLGVNFIEIDATNSIESIHKEILEFIQVL